jgi:predicted RND superfamily exporter protein
MTRHITLRNLLKFAFLFALIITSNINRFIAMEKTQERQEKIDPREQQAKSFLGKHKWLVGIAVGLIVVGSIGTGVGFYVFNDKDSDKKPEEGKVTDNETKE